MTRYRLVVAPHIPPFDTMTEAILFAFTHGLDPALEVVSI